MNSGESANPGRSAFLVAMYTQLHQGISRHAVGVWQSITTLLAAVGALSLAEKHVLSADVAVSFVMLTLVWFLAQVIDANYWYGRNLAMISNIERQFLEDSDLRNVHYYFGQHRAGNVFLTNFRIHLLFGLSLLVLVLGYHCVNSVVPELALQWCSMKSARGLALPYIITLFGAAYLWRLRRRRMQAYEEFVK